MATMFDGSDIDKSTNLILFVYI